jgi:cytochrome c
MVRRFSNLAMAVMVAVLLSERPTIWAQADSGQIARGEKVYVDKKCALCHAINGKGGKAGPDLSAVGAKRDANWLKAFLKDPKATNPKSKMMSFKGDGNELEALAAYLTSLK